MLEFSSNLEHTTLKKKIPLELWCLNFLEHTTTKKSLLNFFVELECLRKKVLQAWVCLLDRKSKEEGMKRNENQNSEIGRCPNLTLNKKPDQIFFKKSNPVPVFFPLGTDPRVKLRFYTQLKPTLRFSPGSIPDPCLAGSGSTGSSSVIWNRK